MVPPSDSPAPRPPGPRPKPLPGRQTRRRRVRAVAAVLSQRYPDTRIPLDHESPLQLLIATILSARSTDAMVNRVTPGLFNRYPTAEALAQAPLEDLESILRPTGFFRQKARAVKETAGNILETFHGQVPKTMDRLVTLPGVGRKTANVMLAAARIHQWPGWARGDDGIGIVVDTHVTRLSRRLGLTAHEDPVKIEDDLKAVTARHHWPTFPLHLIFLGREICTARSPDCHRCPISRWCPAAPYKGDTPWLR